jgi:hypothetical protein
VRILQTFGSRAACSLLRICLPVRVQVVLCLRSGFTLEVAKAPRQNHIHADAETGDDRMWIACIHFSSRLVVWEVDIQELAAGDAGCIVAGDSLSHRICLD